MGVDTYAANMDKLAPKSMPQGKNTAVSGRFPQREEQFKISGNPHFGGPKGAVSTMVVTDGWSAPGVV